MGICLFPLSLPLFCLCYPHGMDTRTVTSTVISSVAVPVISEQPGRSMSAGSGDWHGGTEKHCGTKSWLVCLFCPMGFWALYCCCPDGIDTRQATPSVISSVATHVIGGGTERYCGPITMFLFCLFLEAPPVADLILRCPCDTRQKNAPVSSVQKAIDTARKCYKCGDSCEDRCCGD